MRNKLVKSRYHHSDNRYIAIVLSIICFALIVRLLGLDKGIWLDEYASLALAFNDNFFQDRRIFDHPPLYFLLLRVWSYFSTSEPFLRFLSVIFGIGTIIVLIQWMRRYGKRASVLAGLLCASLPMMLRYSQEIRQYPLLLLATALAFFFASRLIDKPSARLEYAGLAFSLVLAVNMHLVGVMVIPSVLLFIALQVDYRRVRWDGAAAVVVAPAVAFSILYFVLLQHIRGGTTSWIPQVSLGLISTTTQSVFGVDTLRAALGAWQGDVQGMAWLMYLPHVLGVLLGIGVMLGNWRQSWPLLAATLSFWAQIIIYSAIATPILWYRTMLPGLIPAIGFLAVQISTVRIRGFRLMASVALIFSCGVFVVDWATSRAWVPFEPWRQFAEVVRANYTDNQLVVFYPRYVEGPVTYYYPQLPASHALALGPTLSMDDMQQISEQAKAVDASGVMLVVRSDLALEQHTEAYERLRSYLEQQFGPPTSAQELQLLSLSKYGTQGKR